MQQKPPQQKPPQAPPRILWSRPLPKELGQNLPDPVAGDIFYPYFKGKKQPDPFIAALQGRVSQENAAYRQLAQMQQQRWKRLKEHIQNRARQHQESIEKSKSVLLTKLYANMIRGQASAKKKKLQQRPWAQQYRSLFTEKTGDPTDAMKQSIKRIVQAYPQLPDNLEEPVDKRERQLFLQAVHGRIASLMDTEPSGKGDPVPTFQQILKQYYGQAERIPKKREQQLIRLIKLYNLIYHAPTSPEGSRSRSDSGQGGGGADVSPKGPKKPAFQIWSEQT